MLLSSLAITVRRWMIRTKPAVSAQAERLWLPSARESAPPLDGWKPFRASFRCNQSRKSWVDGQAQRGIILYLLRDSKRPYDVFR
jgi:hypothetical protein